MTPADVLVGALEDEQMHRRAKSIYDFYRAAHSPQPPDQGLPSGSPPDASPSTHYPIPATRSVLSPTYTVVPDVEHELWHPSYLHAIKTALDRLKP